MSIGLAVFAILSALYAFGCYRAGAYFGRFYQWRTREEYPHGFWINIVFYCCMSLMLAALAINCRVHGE
jgi:hypothetical protein